MTFKVPRPEDEVTDRAVGTLEARISELEDMPLANGSLIKNVPATAASFIVIHGLKRKPKGWIITKSNTHVTLRTPVTPTEGIDQSKFLELEASASATIDLLVF